MCHFFLLFTFAIFTCAIFTGVIFTVPFFPVPFLPSTKKIRWCITKGEDDGASQPHIYCYNIFNSVPRVLRNLTSISTEKFKKELDKWLATMPGQTSGYCSTTSNSLHSVVPIVVGGGGCLVSADVPVTCVYWTRLHKGLLNCL